MAKVRKHPGGTRARWHRFSSQLRWHATAHGEVTNKASRADRSQLLGLTGPGFTL